MGARKKKKEENSTMTLRYLVIGGATAIALGAFALTQISSDPASAAPAATRVASAPAAATMPLDKIRNPMQSLVKLAVVDRAGKPVGTVTDVVTRSDGKAVAVTVEASPYFGHHKFVGIQAEKVGLDQGRRVLVTYLTPAELKALPSI